MPVHWVEFRRGFWIAKTEITNDQYERFDAHHERSVDSSGDDHPVVDVSWEYAKRYCAWLSERSGRQIRLPSESEWECACRAGSEGEYCFGGDEEGLEAYAWFDDNSEGGPHPVATKRANDWGLVDLSGNVWEWCADPYHESYQGAPVDGTAWVDEGTPFRVVRGGSWGDPAWKCGSSIRAWCVPADCNWRLGFRPAFVRPPED
jgi:formylglycine-generating enzyme required for sulfatase activity